MATPAAFGAVNTVWERQAFRYAVQGVTPVATPTDFLQIAGSATRAVRIRRLYVGGVATTAGSLVCQVIRRSTAGTPGSATLTAVTAGQHDPGDNAPTGTVKYVQTANYSVLGASAGTLSVGRLYLQVAATGASVTFTEEFGARQDKPWILRGAADVIWLNFAGATLPTGTAIDFVVETEEDTF